MSGSLKSGFKKAARYLPAALFILVILFSWYTAYHFANNIIDSDSSSELVLGHFLAGQNRIVSSDWFYGSELRMFNTNLIYMPLFKIFSDWSLVRFLSICILQAVLVLSYGFLSKQTGFSRNTFFLTASMMLLPISSLYGMLILYQSYYIPCAAYGFLIVGLYLSAVRHRGDGHRAVQGFRVSLLLGLSVISCMNGARQMPATMITLPIAALLVAIKTQEKPWSLAGVAKPQWANVGLAFAVFLAGSAGFLVHNLVLSRYFVFSSTTGAEVALPTVDNILAILKSYLYQFGFQEGRLLFSIEGLLTLGSVLTAAVFFALAARKLLAKPCPGQSYPAVLMFHYYPAALLIMTVIFFLSPYFQGYRSFYLMVIVWLFPLIGAAFDRVSPKRMTVRRAILFLACLGLFASGIYYNFYYLHPEGKRTEFSTLADLPINTLDKLRGVLDFIGENGYEVGYATHWQCNVITEATNGEVPMIRIIRVYPYPMYAYDDVLTYKQTRELSFVEDKDMFLLLTRDEADVFSGSDLAAFAIPVYDDENYTVFTFDFSTEVWDYLLEQAKTLNQTSVLEQLLPEGA